MGRGSGVEGGAGPELVRQMARDLAEDDVVQREAVAEGVRHLELVEQAVVAHVRLDLLGGEELVPLGLNAHRVELELLLARLVRRLRHLGRLLVGEVARALEERRAFSRQLLRLDLLDGRGGM